jgi:hypothetical protein
MNINNIKWEWNRLEGREELTTIALTIIAHLVTGQLLNNQTGENFDKLSL